MVGVWQARQGDAVQCHRPLSVQQWVFSRLGCFFPFLLCQRLHNLCPLHRSETTFPPPSLLNSSKQAVFSRSKYERLFFSPASNSAAGIRNVSADNISIRPTANIHRMKSSMEKDSGEQRGVMNTRLSKYLEIVLVGPDGQCLLPWVLFACGLRSLRLSLHLVYSTGELPLLFLTRRKKKRANIISCFNLTILPI